MTATRDHYCHACAVTHKGWNEDQINAHRSILQAAEARRIDRERVQRGG